MIAKVVIKKSTIVSAVILKKNDQPARVELKKERRNFEWPGKWDVTVDPFSGITCTSNRPGRHTLINQVRFEVRYNGMAELTLRTEEAHKVIKTERVFAIPGDFSGVLHLVYNENGHRGAWFISQEYLKFLHERCIDWVVPQEANEFELDLKGLFTHSLLGSGSFQTERRLLLTDGTINIVTVGEKSKITIADATWVLLKKKHLESGRIQTVLFTSQDFTRLGNIPVVNDEEFDIDEIYGELTAFDEREMACAV